MSKIFEIIACPVCKGMGSEEIRTEANAGADYHRRSYDVSYSTCKHCEGSGLVTKITEVIYEPYNPRR